MTMADRRDVENNEQSQTARGVATAALRALTAWLLVYGVISQMLVVWNWRSLVDDNKQQQEDIVFVLETHHRQKEQEAASTATMEDNSIDSNVTTTDIYNNNTCSLEDTTSSCLEPQATTASSQTRMQSSAVSKERVAALSESAAQLSELVQELHAAERQQQDLRQSVEERLGRLVTTIATSTDETSSSSTTTMTRPPETASLEALVVSSSSSRRSPTMQEMTLLWRQARHELEDMAKHNATLDWREVQRRLESLAADAQVSMVNDETSTSTTQQQHCPSNNDAATTMTLDLARESHLFTRVRQVEAALERRLDLEPNQEWKHKIQQVALEEREEMLLSANKKTTTTSTTASMMDSSSSSSTTMTNTCIQTDDLLDMVESGLLALQRRVDVRSVLERKVLELDPSSPVILDAMLMMTNRDEDNNDNEYSSSHHHHHVFNLRQFLDTPLLQSSVVPLVDALVDVTSGYHDGWDQAVDRVLEQYDNYKKKDASLYRGEQGKGEDEETIITTVGQVVVSQLLSWAGRVQVPSDVVDHQWLPPVLSLSTKKQRSRAGILSKR